MFSSGTGTCSGSTTVGVGLVGFGVRGQSKNSCLSTARFSPQGSKKGVRTLFCCYPISSVFRVLHSLLLSSKPFQFPHGIDHFLRGARLQRAS